MTDQNSSGGFFDGVGGGAPSFAFSGVNSGIKGTVVEQYLTVVTDTSGNKKHYDNGDEIPQLNVTLQTDLRSWDKVKKVPEVDGAPKPASEDDGKRRIYVKYDMRRAIGVALQEAGVKDLATGGVLMVKQTGEKKTQHPNPLPLYEARYEPPAASAEFFGGDEQTAGTPASAPSNDEPPF